MKKQLFKNKRLNELFTRFTKSKTAVISLVILGIILFVVLFADLIVPYSKAIEINMDDVNLSPSLAHLFGTDNFGRDVFARIIHGARVSIFIGLSSTLLAMVISTLLGILAGYRAGVVDNIIMRIMDIMISIPTILLNICIISILGNGVVNLIIAMTIGHIPNFTRIVRSIVMSGRQSGYIEASKASGASEWHIMMKHILPNALPSIIIQASMNISGTIVSAAGMSYIGLGCTAPQPEWGLMLSEAKDVMRLYPHLAVFPGVAIIFTALGFNLFGDGLRDALDPKLRN